MSNKRTLTVVYEINNDEVFMPHFDQIRAAFLLDKSAPFRAYCMSIEDEPHRAGLMHEASQHEDYRSCDLADLIKEIWQEHDLTRYEDLKSFLSRKEEKSA